jgi:hypothetical protein
MIGCEVLAGGLSAAGQDCPDPDTKGFLRDGARLGWRRARRWHGSCCLTAETNRLASLSLADKSAGPFKVYCINKTVVRLGL